MEENGSRLVLEAKGITQIFPGTTALQEQGDEAITAETFRGLAGMGDLVLTCTGSLSRNRTVGFELGQGKSLDEVLDLTRGRADLNVEIKSPQPDWEETAEVLAGLLEHHKRLDSTIVSCFEIGALQRVKQPIFHACGKSPLLD